MIDASELVARLRACAQWGTMTSEFPPEDRLEWMAADALEAQAREIERLRLVIGDSHPGYVIGMHWMAAAYARICAGEPEERVIADYGYKPEERLADAERDALRYRWLRHRLPVTAIHCRDECVKMMPADCVEPTDEAYAVDVDAVIDAAMREGK